MGLVLKVAVAGFGQLAAQILHLALRGGAGLRRRTRRWHRMETRGGLARFGLLHRLEPIRHHPGSDRRRGGGDLRWRRGRRSHRR